MKEVPYPRRGGFPRDVEVGLGAGGGGVPKAASAWPPGQGLRRGGRTRPAGGSGASAPRELAQSRLRSSRVQLRLSSGRPVRSGQAGGSGPGKTAHGVAGLIMSGPTLKGHNGFAGATDSASHLVAEA